MSNAARKARKKAGIKFEKAAKVGTPFKNRAWFTGDVFGPTGTNLSSIPRPRSAKKLQRALDARAA